MGNGTGSYNLCINQGATFSLVFTWSTINNTAVGAAQTPVDLTGYTATLQIKNYPLSATILYDASPNITLGGQAGTISLSIPETVTEGFTWWQGVYDLLMTSPGGIATRLLQGNVSVSPGVSEL